MRAREFTTHCHRSGLFALVLGLAACGPASSSATEGEGANHDPYSDAPHLRGSIVAAPGVRIDGLEVAYADGSASVTLDSSGSFDLRLRDAPMAVRLAPPDLFASATAAALDGRAWFAPLDLGTHGGAQDVDLGDVHVDAGFPLEGTVVDDKGAAAQQVRAVVVLGGALLYSVMVKEDGTFRLPGVRSDGYTVLFGEVRGDPGWAPRSAELSTPAPSEEPLRVELRGGKAIVLHCLLEPDGGPVTFDAPRSVRIEGSPAPDAPADEQEHLWSWTENLSDLTRLRVRVASAGKYDVTVSVDGFKSVTEYGVIVTEDADAECVARLTPPN